MLQTQFISYTYDVSSNKIVLEVSQNVMYLNLFNIISKFDCVIAGKTQG